MNNNDENLNNQNSDDKSFEDIFKQRDVLIKALKKILIEIEKRRTTNV